MDPAFKADPFPAYARLRAEAPICRTTLPDGRGLWLVTRYDDTLAVLRDERFVKDWRNALSPEQLELSPYAEVSEAGQSMINMDGSDHARLRALVQKAFTVPFVERLRGRIQEIADQLIDAVKARGHMDLLNDYAFPLPIQVIAEMLGAPKEDRDQIREWSDVIISLNGKSREEVHELRPRMAAFAEYVRHLCDARRSAPRDDLISGLVQAEEQGEKLTQTELIAMVRLLLVAGHETTVNLLGNGMLALFEYPDERAKLQQDPSLIKPAVEEMLRYNGPAEMSTTRFAGEDLEFRGARIPKGEMVLVVLTSANRDRSRFEAPDQLDITRADNKHLAFGNGIHYCVGAPLARLEGQIGIATLLRRLPDMQLAVPLQEIRWRPSLVVRGAQQIPVVFSPEP
jgi:cytochrome P450